MDRMKYAGGAPGAVVKNLGWQGAALAVLMACFATIPAAHGADGRDALFEDDDPLPKAKSEKKTGGVTGYIQLEAARTVSSPDHWSKLRARGELASRGDLGGMSFGFTVPKGGEVWNGTNRTLQAVTLHEISVVSAWPAYPDTEIALRGKPPLDDLAAIKGIAEFNRRQRELFLAEAGIWAR